MGRDDRQRRSRLRYRDGCGSERCDRRRRDLRRARPGLRRREVRRSRVQRPQRSGGRFDFAGREQLVERQYGPGDLVGRGGRSGGSGLAGYSIEWNHAAVSTPDAVVDVPHTADPHSTTSPALADGNDWYFHLRTCDLAGNCTATVHAGPFWIDATAPGSALRSRQHDACRGRRVGGRLDLDVLG